MPAFPGSGTDIAAVQGSGGTSVASTTTSFQVRIASSPSSVTINQLNLSTRKVRKAGAWVSV